MPHIAPRLGAKTVEQIWAEAADLVLCPHCDDVAEPVGGGKRQCISCYHTFTPAQKTAEIKHDKCAVCNQTIHQYPGEHEWIDDAAEVSGDNGHLHMPLIKAGAERPAGPCQNCGKPVPAGHVTFCPSCQDSKVGAKTAKAKVVKTKGQGARGYTVKCDNWGCKNIRPMDGLTYDAANTMAETHNQSAHSQTVTSGYMDDPIWGDRSAFATCDHPGCHANEWSGDHLTYDVTDTGANHWCDAHNNDADKLYSERTRAQNRGKPAFPEETARYGPKSGSKTAASQTVHTFGSSGEAYNRSQTDDKIKHGDILHVPTEGVVGYLHEAWPVAVTRNAGEFHQLEGTQAHNGPIGKGHQVCQSCHGSGSAPATANAPYRQSGDTSCWGCSGKGGYPADSKEKVQQTYDSWKGARDFAKSQGHELDHGRTASKTVATPSSATRATSPRCVG